MSNKLTITLDGKDDMISVTSFISVVRSTVAVLDELAGQKSIWSVGNVSHSSPLNFEVVGTDASASNKVGIFLSGLEELENGNGRPSCFNDDALKRIKKIAKPLSNGLTTLIFRSDDGKAVRATKNLGDSANKFLTKKEYFSYTELYGQLGEIAVHAGKSEFCIFDPITDFRTVCRFNANDAESVGSYITHRIRVVGNAKYDVNDNPVYLDVEDWSVVGEPISISDIHRAKIKLKEGTNSADLVRKLRDLDA